VDICITTPVKELQHVCLLAEALANREIFWQPMIGRRTDMRLTCRLDGMERVICVSHAKVPIVKIWDPDLQLACDMNVNNTLALENTRMIRTYVDIDERVRPLAMIVKYWTRRRILNDAGVCAPAFNGIIGKKRKKRVSPLIFAISQLWVVLSVPTLGYA
jgi:hypothetical protein